LRDNIKILVIEDDPAIMLGLQELLKYENYDVINYSDGKQGFEAALHEQPDLIILDINLPSINGFEVCRKLRQKNFLNPITILTSRNDQVDRIIALELGAVDYITKPFDSRELLARIHAQLMNAERLGIREESARAKKSSRRLLAVMFTDMKDYSRKMNINEKLALSLLEIHNKVVKDEVSSHQGKIVEIIGDAFVATFDSAVKAVECANEIQERFRLYSEMKGPDEQIEVRIGIHLGDIIVQKDKIKGDTVNIAARIQQNSVPGEVTMSENVYTTVRNKIKFEAEYIEEFYFKNIKDPVKLYRLKL
jgi:DNA-binding response OmpR family regulator